VLVISNFRRTSDRVIAPSVSSPESTGACTVVGPASAETGGQTSTTANASLRHDHSFVFSPATSTLQVALQVPISISLLRQCQICTSNISSPLFESNVNEPDLEALVLARLFLGLGPLANIPWSIPPVLGPFKHIQLVPQQRPLLP
jgi:hypothetical protein